MAIPPDVPPPGRTREPAPLRRSLRAEGGLGGLHYRAGVELRELVREGSRVVHGPAPAAFRPGKLVPTAAADEEREDSGALRRWESEGGAMEG